MRSVLLLCGLLAGAPVLAQDLTPPAPRQGYYLSGGVGGLLDTNFDGGGWYRGWPGAGVSVRVGQGLSSWLDLGLTLDFGWAAGRKRQATFGGLSIAAEVHLGEGVGLRGSAGFGFLSAQELEAEEGDMALGGVGGYYAVGVTYHWFPFHDGGESGGLAFTPVVQMRVLPADDLNALVGWVGIEVTYWFGLPSNQLDLPAAQAFAP